LMPETLVLPKAELDQEKHEHSVLPSQVCQ
jgi:hypothetical protein